MEKRLNGFLKKAIILTVIMTLTLCMSVNSAFAAATDADSNKLPAKYTKIDGLDNEGTIIGFDVTRYQQQKNDWDKVWKDYDENEVDLFSFLKTQSVNTVSVKVAVNPTGDNSYLSIDNALATVKSAHDAGLKTNVVLLYSDEMTWKGVQNLPAGWEVNASDANDLAYQLFVKASDYTEDVLKQFEEKGAIPDIVTIGHEVNYDFLNCTGDNEWVGWQIMRQLSTFIKEKYSSIKVGYCIAAPSPATDIQWVINGDHLNKSDWLPASYDYLEVNLYGDTHDSEYITALKSKYHESQWGDNADAKLVVTAINYPYIATDPAVDLYTQMDSVYGFLKDIAGEGGFVYEGADYVGDWKSLFAADGAAIPTIGVIQQAVTGSTSAYIDPYKYGGEFNLKEIKANITPIEGMNDSTIRGVDVSSYKALKNAGVKFYDNNGNEASLMKVLSDNGVNYIRIRVWNDPYNENGETYGGGSNDPETSLDIAKEATENGMKVELCIHYSDFWADPSQQILPKAWKNDASDPEKIKNHVYSFTKEILTKYKEAGVNIGMVQVGNEITNGAFGIMRESKTSYDDFWKDSAQGGRINAYFNAGAKAVREICPDALVALHIDTTTDATYRVPLVESWENDKVDYDVIGISHYPFWGSSTKSLKDMAKLAEKYGKLFLVFETAWTNSLKDADGKGHFGETSRPNMKIYGVGVQAQVDELHAMYKDLSETNNGIGAFYWEPAWIPVKPGWAYWQYNLDMANQYGTGWAAKGADGYFNYSKMHWNGQDSWGPSTWENLALFDNNGYPLDSLRFYKDSVPASGKGVNEKFVFLNFVDENGKKLSNTTAVRVQNGKTATAELPKISGYAPESGVYTLDVKGDGKYITYQDVKYVVSKTEAADDKKTDDKTTTETDKPTATTEETTKADPTKEMGKDGTALGTGASAEAADKAITAAKTDKDLKGSVYRKLKLKQSKVTKTSITVKWNKVKNAKKYVIYAGKSGKSNKIKKVATVTKTSYTLKKFNKKKLAKGTYYKFAVVALNSKGKVVTASKFAHIATLGKKAASNPAKVTTKAKNNKVTVKVKKTFKLKGAYASSAKKYKIKKVLGMRYESSNTKVATVSSKGVIKGVKKGTCYVYAYAQNGIAKKIKVTVKK